MSFSAAYYSPILTPFVMALEKYGVGHLKRKYRSGADGAIMYIVIFANPYTGHMIEIHSPAVQYRLRPEFKSLVQESCPGALELSFSNGNLGKWWKHYGGAVSNARGLPDLLLVKVSQPTSNLGSIKAFTAHMSNTFAWPVSIERGYVSTNETDSSEQCAYTASVFQTPSGEGFVEMRTVYNPQATVGIYSVKDWEDYVKVRWAENWWAVWGAG